MKLIKKKKFIPSRFKHTNHNRWVTAATACRLLLLKWLQQGSH